MNELGEVHHKYPLLFYSLDQMEFWYGFELDRYFQDFLFCKFQIWGSRLWPSCPRGVWHIHNRYSCRARRRSHLFWGSQQERHLCRYILTQAALLVWKYIAIILRIPAIHEPENHLKIQLDVDIEPTLRFPGITSQFVTVSLHCT